MLAKIENQQGIDNIDEIIEAADGIMIARGDMGIEVPFEMVPVYQKMIITKVNAAGKVVVTATNMLETMTEKPRATRSEVSDVFNAVIDGTDATMLSGESANGKYPVESVRTMATIDKNAQTLLKEYGRLDSSTFDRSTKTEVVASAVKDATNSMDIKLVVALTESGNTARLISKYRPNADILALTFDELTERGLMLNWGVIPMLTEAPSSTDDMFEIAERKAVEAGLVQSGDDIVIVAGVPLGEAVRTNTMRIRTVRYLESPAVGPQNHIRCKQAAFALNLFALLKTVPEFLWDLLLLCTFYIKTAFSGNANRIPIAENIVVNLICINDIRAGCKLLPVFCQFNHPKLKGKLWSYHTQCIYYSFQSSGANQGQRLCTLCVTHS